ncbi:adenosylcobinamide-phosphate synthase CbiB [Clostridium sp. LBM24168]
MELSLIQFNFIDVVIAVILDWIIGDPLWFPHPVVFMGKLIGFLENRARAKCITNRGMKYFGGFIVLVLVSSSFLLPFVILFIFRNNVILFNLINILFLCTCLSARCLDKEASKVYTSLKYSGIEDARKKLSGIVGRDTKNLDEGQITRAAVETVAENTSDGVVAPLFYGIIFASPLSMAYKAVNTMDSMLGYMNENYRYIGFFPAKVDDFFNLIPARLTGFLMCIMSPLVGGNLLDTFKIMLRDRKNHKSPNCAYPEAAAAGAMEIQLGGTNIYFGEVFYKPHIGDRKRELNADHIKGVIKLMYFSEMGAVLTAAAIYTILMGCVG